ncbi:MAG: Lipoprotein [uncultured Clostridium sp.]
MVDIAMEMLMPWIVMAVSFIIFVIVSVNLICLLIGRRKAKKNDESYDRVQRAIIVLGNEKIEVEVVDYEIEENIVEIQSIDGKVYITDIKNVLLMGE